MVKRESTIKVLSALAISKIDRLESRVGLSIEFDDFIADDDKKDIAHLNLVIIGDICNEILNRQEDVDYMYVLSHAKLLKNVYKFWDKIAHGYDTLDWKLIHNVLKYDLPNIKTMFNDMIDGN